MNIERLKKEKHEESRELYEEVFPEDSRKFVDYYYREKASSNEIFVIKEGEEICSMIHLNPYLLWEDGKEEKGAYLVAVATKKEFRHRGLMTSLLKEAFTFLYKNQYPFLYLMPASEAIYLPFDFRVFYWQNQCIVEKSQRELLVKLVSRQEKEAGKKGKTKFWIREAKEQDFTSLCDISNEILGEQYRLFAKRTPQYFTDLVQELEAMNGRLFLIFAEKSCIGSFQLIQEKKTTILEPLIKKQDILQGYAVLMNFLEEKGVIEREIPVEVAAFSGETAELLRKMENGTIQKKPWMMGRIIHLERWVSHLKSEQTKKVLVEVMDSWIRENEGRYEITVGCDGGTIRRIDPIKDGEKDGFHRLSIADLPEFFKRETPTANAFFNEWV